MQRTSDKTCATDRKQEYLVFRLADREYGIAVEKVQELTTYCAVKPVVNAPGQMAGVITLRGHQLPVFNLHDLLFPGIPENGRLSDVVILRHADQPCGIAVDCVIDVLSLLPDQVSAPTVAYDTEGHRLTGIATIGRRMVCLLDVERLIAEFQPGMVEKRAA